jgi:hypothetical protein
MDDDIVPPAILQLLGENFDPAVGTEFDDEEPLPSELEGISTRTCFRTRRVDAPFLFSSRIRA